MRRRLRRLCATILVLFLILMAAFFALRSKYRLTIRDLAETSVKNATSDLANDAIAKQIENEMNYPGQVKINLIRESRVVDYAK